MFLDLADFEIAKSVIDLTMFDEIPNLSPITMKALVRDLGDNQRFSVTSEKQRFKQAWIQSTSFTDLLAEDARVLSTVITSVLESEGKTGK